MSVARSVERKAKLPSTATPIVAKSMHAETAATYARDVINGRAPASAWVVKAAQRHIDDLARANNEPNYPYYFDPEKGARVCRFIELFRHVKGKWAQRREQISLSPWQCFLIVVLFGWLRKDNDKRRFREAYWAIPRKNGKSTLAAGIGLYMFAADGEFGAEVYSGATTERQAWEVFRPARMMAFASSEFQEFYGIQVWTKHLLRPEDGSRFEPVVGNPGDGSSPSCAIVDEFHEHDTPALYDTMNTGMGSREQPLLLIITTAGYNIAGPCYDKQDEAQKVLNKVIENDQLFAVIFGTDPKDDWADPRSLIKANPNYNISVDGEFLAQQQRNAMANPLQQVRFKTKHLNIWCSVLEGLVNMQLWALADMNTQRAEGSPFVLDEEELIEKHAECAFGVDLASKSDLCTEQRCYRFTFPNQTKPHFYLFGRYWLPEAAVEEEGPNRAAYMKWVIKGFLTQTDGAVIDFAQVRDQIIADHKVSNPKEVVYDPHIATPLAVDLMAEKIEVVEFVQTPHNFTVPVDELLSALKDGRFHHDGNEVTTWCFSNVVARPARKGMNAPTKQKGKGHQKIDGAIAAFMAMGRLCAVEQEPEYGAFVI